METVYFTESFFPTYNTARCYNPEYRDMNFYDQENLKSFESTFS